MGGEVEGGDGLAVTLLEVGGLGDRRVERLGFAVGRNVGALNHLGFGDKAGAGRGSDRKIDVQEGEARLLERDGGAAGEMLAGEVEEGEGAQGSSLPGGGAAQGLEAGDLGGRKEVAPGEVEGELGIRAAGHLEVEDDVACLEAEVEDAGRDRAGGGWIGRW